MDRISTGTPAVSVGIGVVMGVAVAVEVGVSGTIVGDDVGLAAGRVAVTVGTAAGADGLAVGAAGGGATQAAPSPAVINKAATDKGTGCVRQDRSFGRADIGPIIVPGFVSLFTGFATHRKTRLPGLVDRR